MADPDMSLEHRRLLRQRGGRGRTTATAGDEALPVSPGDAAVLADPRLLRIEQKLDRMARQISGLPTVDGLRATMVMLAMVAVGAGLIGGVLIHP